MNIAIIGLGEVGRCYATALVSLPGVRLHLCKSEEKEDEEEDDSEEEGEEDVDDTDYDSFDDDIPF